MRLLLALNKHQIWFGIQIQFSWLFPNWRFVMQTIWLINKSIKSFSALFLWTFKMYLFVKSYWRIISNLRYANFSRWR